MRENIQIIEKPEWVSWDDIKRCLYSAHATNRANGINMAHYQWPAEKIKDSLGEHGVMLVALDDKKVVGTAAIGEKFGKAWYAEGRYAYMCFAGILPEYNGRGIYKALVEKREEIAKSLGFNILVFDTHYSNLIIQKIAVNNGYRYVHFFCASNKDHFSVIMVKWLSACPFSNRHIDRCFRMSKFLTKIQYNSQFIERSRGLSYICLIIKRLFSL